MVVLDPKRSELLETLATIDFADRYFAYCEKHRVLSRDKLPLTLQKKVMASAKLGFDYTAKWKGFEHFEPESPKGTKLGIGVSFQDPTAMWALIFELDGRDIGGPFSGIANNVKQLSHPGYKHVPFAVRPSITNEKEFRAVVSEGVALYKDAAAAISKRSWT